MSKNIEEAWGIIYFPDSGRRNGQVFNFDVAQDAAGTALTARVWDCGKNKRSIGPRALVRKGRHACHYLHFEVPGRRQIWQWPKE